MVVDKVKTAEYYETFSAEDLCDCDYCKLYHSKSKKAYPELADWFLQYGIEGDFFVLEAYPMYLCIRGI